MTFLLFLTMQYICASCMYSIVAQNNINKNTDTNKSFLDFSQTRGIVKQSQQICQLHYLQSNIGNNNNNNNAYFLNGFPRGGTLQFCIKPIKLCDPIQVCFVCYIGKLSTVLERNPFFLSCTQKLQFDPKVVVCACRPEEQHPLRLAKELVHSAAEVVALSVTILFREFTRIHIIILLSGQVECHASLLQRCY